MVETEKDGALHTLSTQEIDNKCAEGESRCAGDLARACFYCYFFVCGGGLQYLSI